MTEALRGWPVRASFDLAHSLADLLCWSDDAVGRVTKSGWEPGIPRDRVVESDLFSATSVA
eukprot:5373360-Prymnesium_polylepis.3